MDLSHSCPIPRAAGGRIRADWCFAARWEVIRDLPDDLTEETVQRPELLLDRDGRVAMYYVPFDLVRPEARVHIVGVTPGRRQMFLALRAAQAAIREGCSAEEILRRADRAGAFAGRMRTNLVSMLDGIGLNAALGIDSCASLFDEHDHLVDSNSLFCYAVFVDGGNYNGYSPRIHRVPLLREYLDRVFAEVVRMTGRSLLIPLGKVPTQALERLAGQGKVDLERCLLHFPHPSPANGWRERLYDRHRAEMAAKVRRWFRRRGLGPHPTDPALAAAPRR